MSAATCSLSPHPVPCALRDASVMGVVIFTSLAAISAGVRVLRSSVFTAVLVTLATYAVSQAALVHFAHSSAPVPTQSQCFFLNSTDTLGGYCPVLNEYIYIPDVWREDMGVHVGKPSATAGAVDPLDNSCNQPIGVPSTTAATSYSLYGTIVESTPVDRVVVVMTLLTQVLPLVWATDGYTSLATPVCTDSILRFICEGLLPRCTPRCGLRAVSPSACIAMHRNCPRLVEGVTRLFGPNGDAYPAVDGIFRSLNVDPQIAYTAAYQGVFCLDSMARPPHEAQQHGAHACFPGSEGLCICHNTCCWGSKKREKCDPTREEKSC